MSQQHGSYDIDKTEASNREEGPNTLKVQPTNQIVLRQVKNVNEKDQRNETTASTGPTETFPLKGNIKGQSILCGQEVEVLEEVPENDEEQQLLPQDSQQQAVDNNGQTFANTRLSNPSSNGSNNLYQKDLDGVNDNDDDENLYENKMPQSPLKIGVSKMQQLNVGDILSPADDSKTHRRKLSKIDEIHSRNVSMTPGTLNTLEVPQGVGAANAAKKHNDSGNGNSHHHHTPKWWLYFQRKWTNISEQLGLLAIFLSLWGVAFILFPQYAVPTTGIMRIAFLFVGAQLTGILVSFAHLPDMLGMLFFGVLYTNVGLADFTGYQPLEAFLREMALINIMLLAGLGLDAGAFKKLWAMILRLTLIPTVAEVGVIAFLGHYTLHMPLLFSILLGLVVTAVSPNVVVTVMLKLKEERLGLNSGIHTLIYAMTTCNDVVAIFLFGVILGTIYSTGTLTEQILQGPIGIGIGLVFGAAYGLMLCYLPSKNASYKNGVRFVLIVLGGTISVIGSKAIGYPSAGALGCVAIAFVANLGWKKDASKTTEEQKMDNLQSSVPKRLDLLWKFLKPVSFALIGKEINFGVLEGKVVGYGTILVIVGSLFRLCFAYISTYGGNLTRKERAYITISGFPKATVQASIGPIALDLARSLKDDDTISHARNVLIISVLAIIFTAPLGAILMLRLAPVWLKRSDGNADSIEANTVSNRVERTPNNV